MKIIFRRPNFSVLEFGPRRKNWAHAVATPDSMAATAAAVVAQRRRHEAAEAAANLAEGKDGTPRQQPLSPKKVPRKPKKIETKPPLPYQQEVFDFYQNEKIQIFVAVRGPRAAASRHNCPLSRSPGIRTIVPSTAPRSLSPGPDHHRSTARRAPPAWLQLLIVANFIFSIAEKEYDPYPDNVRPHLSLTLLPLSAAPPLSTPVCTFLACSRRSAHPAPTAGPASYSATPHHSRQTYRSVSPSKPSHPPNPPTPPHSPLPAATAQEVPSALDQRDRRLQRDLPDRAPR